MSGTNLDHLRNKILNLKKKTDDSKGSETNENSSTVPSRNTTEEVSVPSRNSEEKRILKSIPIDKIKPNPFQPRTVFEGIEELSYSIEEKGLLQPITVIELDDEYILIAGERRLRACKLIYQRNINYNTIEAIIHDEDISDEEKELLAALENHQRSDMTIIDTANMYASINKYASYTEMNKILGDSRTSISRYIKISSLPEEIKNMLNKKDIKSTNKIELLASLEGNIEKQKEIAHDIINDEPLVRIENKIRKALRGEGEIQKDKTEVILSLYERIKPASKVISKSNYRKLDDEKRNRVDECLNTIIEAQKNIENLIKS